MITSRKKNKICIRHDIQFSLDTYWWITFSSVLQNYSTQGKTFPRTIPGSRMMARWWILDTAFENHPCIVTQSLKLLILCKTSDALLNFKFLGSCFSRVVNVKYRKMNIKTVESIDNLSVWLNARLKSRLGKEKEVGDWFRFFPFFIHFLTRNLSARRSMARKS